MLNVYKIHFFYVWGVVFWLFLCLIYRDVIWQVMKQQKRNHESK